MKTLAYHLCKIDGKGRAVSVCKRKTYAAIRRQEQKANALSLFVVAEYLGESGTSDEGTVFFFDMNGGEVEMVNP